MCSSGGGDNYKTERLESLCAAINPSKTDIKDIDNSMIVSFIEMASISNNGYIETKVDKPLGELRKGGYTYFAENDIIVAKITPCMENGKCAIATGLTNGIGMGSSEFHIFRTNEKVNNKYLFGFLNREDIRQKAEKRMTGASGHRRVPISFYEELQIPVPPLAEQKKIVAEIDKYEAAIAQAQKEMDGAAEKKKEILNKWLK